MPPTRRQRWHRDYLSTVIQRDIAELVDIRRARAVESVLSTAVALTGQVLNIARLARGAGVDTRIARRYLDWLCTVFLVHRVPMWSRNLLGCHPYATLPLPRSRRQGDRPHPRSTRRARRGH